MADITIDANVDSLLSTRGMWGPYWIDNNSGAVVYIDSGEDLKISATKDAGSNWTTEYNPSSTIENISAFFDREVPGQSGNSFYVAQMDSALSRCNFVEYNIKAGSVGLNNSVATGLTVGTTPVASNRSSITKRKDNGFMVCYSTQSEIGQWTSTDGVSWTSGADFYETATEEDWGLLFPANTADNADVAGIFWDRSADEISLKMYDDSANSWTETSIDASAVDDIDYSNMDASVRHSDNHILLAYHNNADSSTDDLKTVDLTVDSIASPTVTAKTDVFTNVAESAQTAVFIDQTSDDVYVTYIKGGTWTSTTDIFYKKSTDGMATWGSETQINEDASDDFRGIQAGRSVTSDTGRFQPIFFNDDLNDLLVNQTNDVEIGVGTDFSETLSDSLTVAELFSSDAEFNRSLTDTISFSDDLASDVIFNRNLTDTITITDSISPSQGFNEALTDSLGITDAFSSNVGFNKSLTETFALVDLLTQTGDVELNLSDGFSMSDSLAKEIGKSLSETLTIADSIAKEQGVGLSDTQTITDSLVKDVVFKIADTLDINDSINIDTLLEDIEEFILKQTKSGFVLKID